MTKNGEVLTAYVTLAKYMQGHCDMPCEFCLFSDKKRQACMIKDMADYPYGALEDKTVKKINANFTKLEREDHHG